MTPVPILLMIVVSIAMALVVVLIAIPRRRRLVSFAERDFPQLARLRNVTTAARVIALIVGLIVVVLLTTVGPLGMGFLLAPAVFAGTQIVATLVAELISRDTARTPGAAGLEVRRIRSYLPRALGTATVVTMTVLTGVLIGTTATGSPDDMGRAGRSFSYSYPCDGVCGGSFSPWPGSFYTAPLGIALLLVVTLAVTAIVITVRRPRDASQPEIVRVDDFIRTRSAESVVAALGLGGAASLAAICVLVSRLVVSTVDGVSRVLLVAGWSAVVVGLIAFGMSMWCVVVLLLPGARARHSHSDAVHEAATVTTP